MLQPEKLCLICLPDLRKNLIQWVFSTKLWWTSTKTPTAHSRSSTSCCKTRLFCLKHLAICFYFIASSDTTTWQPMCWLRILNSPTRCPIKMISNSSMPSFSRKHRPKNPSENSTSAPTDTSIHSDSSPKASKTPDWPKTTMGSKNRWSSSISVSRNISLSWCPRPKFIGTKRTTQLLRNSSGRALNSAQTTRLGNST